MGPDTSSIALQATFLDGSAGRLFVARFAPAGGTGRWLLFLPPFAEEMNKSRRMIARLGYALADAGIGLCLPDHFGTGDSNGDFADADPGIWHRDLAMVAGWLRAEHGCRRLALGGLRHGALLAMQVREALAPIHACLLWQPVHSGQQQLTQFLRLRQAAAMLGNGPRETIKALQQRLEGGESLEIAGYTLSPALARDLAAAQLAGHAPPADCPTLWFEVANREEPALTPVSQQLIDTWQASGSRVLASALRGDSFWTTQELVDAPALVGASAAALAELLPA